LLDVTSPDHVLVSGRLASGAVASVHVGNIPFAGSGYRMEIYGREGTLVASGEDSPQLSEVFLHGAKGGNTLAAMPVPARFDLATAGTPPGEAINVGRMYSLFAQAIHQGAGQNGAGHNGGGTQPNFATAVDLHRLVDGIKQASDSGHDVTFQ
jgi:predicted dehydrogenase